MANREANKITVTTFKVVKPSSCLFQGSGGFWGCFRIRIVSKSGEGESSLVGQECTTPHIWV